MIDLIDFVLGKVSRIHFPVWLQNQLLFAGLELVLNNTEKNMHHITCVDDNL